jgi:three-Cys-motif partner protein
MAKKKYEWSFDCPPPLEQHSLAKHDILKAYLIRYIQTLVSHPSQEELKLTLIDGFSGGGVYSHNDSKEIIYGSPLIMLDAMAEASVSINRKRRKPIKFNIHYFFIDNDKNACICLKETLKSKGYGHLIGESIFVLESSFQDKADTIIEFINKKSRARHAIFLLDQYGYTQVPVSLIKKILYSSLKSEIILNFNVDSLLTYISDTKDLAQKLLNAIGTPHALKGRTIEDIKSSTKDWRLYIQSCLYRDLVLSCGASYYTRFFIRSPEGHGDYWLVHLSQHPKARDVMTEIHWEKNNHFIHYGGAGLDMFMTGYLPQLDNNYTKQAQLDALYFDETAKEKSIEELKRDIVLIINNDSVTFEKLFMVTCNNSPASAKIYKEAIAKLIEYKEIEVVGEQGQKRLSANSIKASDIITKHRQSSIFTF